MFGTLPPLLVKVVGNPPTEVWVDPLTGLGVSFALSSNRIDIRLR
nr:MAG: hypothetical protein H3Bulk42208_000003 [Mitovirus sp.]